MALNSVGVDAEDFAGVCVRVCVYIWISPTHTKVSLHSPPPKTLQREGCAEINQQNRFIPIDECQHLQRANQRPGMKTKPNPLCSLRRPTKDHGTETGVSRFGRPAESGGLPILEHYFSAPFGLIRPQSCRRAGLRVGVVSARVQAP